ncbi:zinc metalloprotease HtpX [Geothrix sp. PMB-07]|uniref:zinc metalloprotease HtpX n=1 Tax=Geothrix sp. PMB-07 TaxID=3068640 RepID=UPI0027427B53|nr:zinc metalloprotease HtpX [Geothrix sp. PMB-07]WLT32552.1 zinc metalloprotease HtpX [Geothrix sp. PMB-07]
MNQTKTLLIIVAMTGLLVWIGGMFGGQSGMVLALAIGLVMNGVSYFFSDKIVLASYGAQPVTQAQAPELHAIVANLAQRAGLPMPRIAIIPDDTPNAFATGRNPEHAVVAVTEGIMRVLSRPELEAVIGHELGHVKHRDILIGSLAAVLAQAIMFLSRLAGYFGVRDEEGRSNPIAGIAIMILGPIAAFMLQMAVSRSREYMADAYSAHLTGRPDMLASALERLEGYNRQLPMHDAQPATAHMMIVNPLAGGGLMSLFSTHPPMAARIERLRGMPIEAR